MQEKERKEEDVIEAMWSKECIFIPFRGSWATQLASHAVGIVPAAHFIGNLSLCLEQRKLVTEESTYDRYNSRSQTFLNGFIGIVSLRKFLLTVAARALTSLTQQVRVVHFLYAL
jgi:hypothetical protein